ncbi:hypothetical protein EJ02DRAFT_494266 [Clathrospora elynae]|uniref:Uncharacterized protein n=1 Tax=Clathrospora elynae TaxID=706981 RepID=A0A6A5SM36_9PLEO|nr:hypothetical protein EJ02DRAFT_494266 [Clathrospora elynae]
MCWFTLTPKKPKIRHHHRPSTDSSCVENPVRVHRGPPSPRFGEVRVKVPSINVEVDEKYHHHLHPRLQHHHRHHLHPLHLHPIHNPLHHLHPHHHHDRQTDVEVIKLRGQARPRYPPPGPPPPSREPSREPRYRTQIVEPAQVRATTRVALQQNRATSGRLRRVSGYEMLGKQVPWNWDCVSSSMGGGSSAGGDGGRWRRKRRGGGGGGGLKYPPFGGMDTWL